MPTYGNITLNRVRKSHNIGEAIDVINSNFDEILRNGGGPTGPAGVAGPQGIPGASIIGPKGDKGDPGSSIHFINEALSDGQAVTNISHLDGDLVIDANGAYYQVISDGSGGLEYDFGINISSLGGQHLVTKAELDVQGGGNPIANHILENANKNVILAKRVADGANDNIEYYRLISGDSPTTLINNSSVVVTNIIPSGDVLASDNPFNQITVKYRPSKTADASLSSLNIRLVDDTDSRNVATIENGSVVIQMINNDATPGESKLLVRSPNVVLNGSSTSESSPTNRISISIEDSVSAITSDKKVNANIPLSINQAMFLPAAAQSVNNGSSFSLDVSGLSVAARKDLSISIPSSRQVGRLSTISGGTIGQIVVIRNAGNGAKGIIIDNSGNITINEKSISLLPGDHATLVCNGATWSHLCSSNVGIKYISSSDIGFDYDNLTHNGTWYVYYESAIDKLQNDISSRLSNSPAASSDGIDPASINNVNPESEVIGYDVITRVYTTYNGLTIQEQMNLYDNSSWVRRKSYDGWTSWQRIHLEPEGYYKWITVGYDSALYDDKLSISSANHRYTYYRQVKTVLLKVNTLATVVTASDSYRIYLPSGVSASTGGLFNYSHCMVILNDGSHAMAWVRQVVNYLIINLESGSVSDGDQIRIIMDLPIIAST